MKRFYLLPSPEPVGKVMKTKKPTKERSIQVDTVIFLWVDSAEPNETKIYSLITSRNL